MKRMGSARVRLSVTADETPQLVGRGESGSAGVQRACGCSQGAGAPLARVHLPFRFCDAARKMLSRGVCPLSRLTRAGQNPPTAHVLHRSLSVEGGSAIARPSVQTRAVVATTSPSSPSHSAQLPPRPLPATGSCPDLLRLDYRSNTTLPRRRRCSCY